jgi:hypothetical protein
MSTDPGPGPGVPLPDWALAQAMNGLDDGDSIDLDDRARQLVQDYEDERHDDDDDPDQGGEA